jgi:hypothetical protein
LYIAYRCDDGNYFILQITIYIEVVRTVFILCLIFRYTVGKTVTVTVSAALGMFFLSSCVMICFANVALHVPTDTTHTLTNVALHISTDTTHTLTNVALHVSTDTNHILTNAVNATATDIS